MSNSWIKLTCFSVLYLIALSVWAKPLYQPFTTPPASTATGSTLPTVSKTILSPSEFNSQAAELSSQNAAAFKQQITQKIAQVTQPMVQTAPQLPKPEQSIPAATTIHSVSSDSAADKTPSVEPPTEEDIPSSDSTSSNETTPSQQNTAAAAAAPSTSTSTPSSSSQPYTGFQSGGQGTSGQSKDSNKGWNIKY